MHHASKTGDPVGRFRWAALTIATLVCIATVTRLVLVGLSLGAWTASPLTTARALTTGAAYDVVVALWLAVPLVAYLTVVTRARYDRRGQRMLRHSAFAMTAFAALFVAAAEVVFFDEFNGRFNFVAVDYLLFPTEVVVNIWQSYPVARVLIAVLGVTLLLVWSLRHRLDRFDAVSGPAWRGRAFAAVTYGVVVALGTLALEPGRARISEDRVANEIAMSGYYSFWQALLGRDAPYEGMYATRPDSIVFPRLRTAIEEQGDEWALGASPTNARRVDATRPSRRLNVVVVLEESFGSAFVGGLHPSDAAPSITPAFDSLILGGTLLTHAYSTGNRTIRALEATTSSLPPLPGISIVRRPESVELFTLANILRARGYATEFIYGGRALFDGMGDYMRNNGMERVVEQGDFPPGTFRTAWGVADEQIFDRALVEMDSLHRTGKPFHTLILTVSNHKPYAYPAGRIAGRTGETPRRSAVRYADWALGRFMRDARSHAFFDSTIFVLMGDHGARVYGAADIPLPSYEVPILFHAPGLVAAGVRVGTLASALDLPPTILALLGMEYESRFFGRDILRADSTDGRAPLTHNTKLALMRGSRIAVLGLRESTQLFDIGANGAFRAVVTPDCAGKALVEEAISYYTGADRLYRRGQYHFHPDAQTAAHMRRPAMPRM